MDRAVGCLVGLAAGDALGLPYEGGEAVGAVGKLRDEMVAAGDLPAGSTSDDTAQAVCIAESLVAKGGFDADDVAQRFVEWYRGGGFGIGQTAKLSLEAISSGATWQDASLKTHEAQDGKSAANGSIMRCAPLGIRFRNDDAQLMDASIESSKITHWDPLAGEAAAAVNLMVARALAGDASPAGIVGEVSFILDDRAQGLRAPDRNASPHARVAGVLREAATSSRDDLDAGSAFCLDTLKTATYFLLGAESFESALVDCVGLGGDSDTNAAVLGAMLGACMGASAIPQRWREAVADAGRLEEMAASLVEAGS